MQFQTHDQMKATNMLLYGTGGKKSKITGCVHPGSLRGELVSFPFLVAGGCLQAWGGDNSLFICVLLRTLLPFSLLSASGIFLCLSLVIVSDLPW